MGAGVTPALIGALLGALAGAIIGALGAKTLNAGLDRQIERASPEDAAKFMTLRRLAGPVVIVTTIVEVAVVGYVAAEFLAG
jgi:NhaP-type Na+/H+ or K+/H+ antiporter